MEERDKLKTQVTNLKSIKENLKTTIEERDKLKTQVTSLTQKLNKVGNTSTPITQTTQITQESSGDIQEDNVQTNVQPVTSGVNSLNTNTSALVRQLSNNTNTGQVQNLPREKPPVKIQRNRGALLPSPPRIGPAQVASPTPAIEEQPLNQSQSVTEEIPAKSTIGHKRSRDEIETEQLCKLIFLIFILNI
jgi:myosin heavy subunit